MSDLPPLTITTAGDRFYLRAGPRHILVAEVLDRKTHRGQTTARLLAAAPLMFDVLENIWAYYWSIEGYAALTTPAPWLEALQAAITQARTAPGANT